MADALNTMKSLERLHLREVRITSSGWVTFFDQLRHPGSALETLMYLDVGSCFGPSTDDYHINDERLNAFAKALEGTTSLVTFSFDVRGITKDGGWDTLHVIHQVLKAFITQIIH